MMVARRKNITTNQVLMFACIAVITVFVMLRLCLMEGPVFPAFHPLQPGKRNLSTLERVFIFSSMILVTVVGYFLQPKLESWLGWNFAPEAATYSRIDLLMSAGLSGSIVAYAAISADDARSKWWRAGVASVMTLTGFDLLIGLQGGISFRGVLFAFVCNLVGGPFGVVVVLVAHKRLRSIMRSRALA
jgi:hypothetical protein